MDMINQLFWNVDRACILRIPSSLVKREDSVTWHYDCRGTYMLKKDDFEIFCIVLWNLTVGRSETSSSMNDSICRDAVTLVENCGRFLHEFQEAKQCIDDRSKTWCCPVDGTVKLNVNAAIHEERGCMGGGSIITDSQGVVVGAQSKEGFCLLRAVEYK
ncbi:hypothetical protein PanWU01x14_211270 [Parasponia andersonii]|uniref:RNase H type-1 domain-containing protein n=1 Tax=Parasponia andersonii TaxID=3476 RepID=A0A2P5BTK3_PARAD|nr:hypothetical protein PanWU01x14_211270 [Parasponia andersonii]